jgi:dihydrolipoamide dehydrogenase
MGLTENDAKAQGIAYEKAAFPWDASGRSLNIGRKEGMTKLLCDKKPGVSLARILSAPMPVN